MSSQMAKPTIVLISDAPFYPLFFRKHLGDLYHFYLVGSSHFSIEQVLRFSFSLVLIDDSDLGEEILTVCREFRKKAEFSTIPILVITNKLKKEYITRLIQAGANGFIREPLDEQDIKEKLRDVEKYRALQGKLDGVYTHFFHPPKEDPLLQTHTLVNKVALEPIIKTIAEGGLVCIGALAIDQPQGLHEEDFRAIGEYLHSHLRKHDLFFHLGSGNCMFFLNQTSARTALLIGETLRESLHTLPPILNLGGKTLTISIGIAAQKRPPYKSLHDMMMDAKNTLMRAKKLGNNTLLHQD